VAGLGLAVLPGMGALPPMLVAAALALLAFALLAFRALDAAERGQLRLLLRHPGGLLRAGGAG
jgi:hypothetical protein